MRSIGNSVNMNDGCDVSSSLGQAHVPNLFTRAFQDNFYAHAGQTGSFEIRKLKDEIKRGFPVQL